MCTLFSQLFRVRLVLSRWTFYKKCFFRWGTNKMLYIQNWWTIPLNSFNKKRFFYFKDLKGLFTNFEYITFCLCLNKRNIFYERSISIKQTWLEIIEKNTLTQNNWKIMVLKVYPCYVYNISRHGLTLSTLFSQLFQVRVVLSIGYLYVCMYMDLE